MDAAATAPAPVASSTESATATTTPTPGVAAETSARPTELAADADAAAPLKAFAQRALEKGKLADAIDAGEQATALDSTDAKSWLVLGGAYQDRGDMVNARRCYRACAEHATRGPVNECRALGGR
jgi:Flp pilus assembly protein TadD